MAGSYFHAMRLEHPFYSDLVRERIDALAELLFGSQKDARHAWAAAIGKWREFLRDPKCWKGTYLDRAVNPPDAPPLQD
jgi:hypothetical protein